MSIKNKQNIKIDKGMLKNTAPKKHKKDKQSTPKRKKEFVYLRDALEGETSVYQLNMFDKFKRMFEVLEENSGRKSKAQALKRKKEQDRLSSLQIVLNNFFQEKLYSKLKLDNADSSKVIEVQLDKRFNAVKGTILSNSNGVHIEELEVNRNYLKYVDSVPIRLIVRKKTEDL